MTSPVPMPVPSGSLTVEATVTVAVPSVTPAAEAGNAHAVRRGPAVTAKPNAADLSMVILRMRVFPLAARRCAAPSGIIARRAEAILERSWNESRKPMAPGQRGGAGGRAGRAQHGQGQRGRDVH